MNGNTYFGKQKLQDILEQEFLISTKGWQKEDYIKAESAFTAFDSLEAFLENTGWRRDNPEFTEEGYLTGNRICRWVNGKFLYFSRLLWEDTE